MVMTTELTGLALRRKACEAVGYSAQRFELTGLKGWAIVEAEEKRK
jgi:hypothetical protein